MNKTVRLRRVGHLSDSLARSSGALPGYPCNLTCVPHFRWRYLDFLDTGQHEHPRSVLTVVITVQVGERAGGDFARGMWRVRPRPGWCGTSGAGAAWRGGYRRGRSPSRCRSCGPRARVTARLKVAAGRAGGRGAAARSRRRRSAGRRGRSSPPCRLTDATGNGGIPCRYAGPTRRHGILPRKTSEGEHRALSDDELR